MSYISSHLKVILSNMIFRENRIVDAYFAASSFFFFFFEGSLYNVSIEAEPGNISISRVLKFLFHHILTKKKKTKTLCLDILLCATFIH